MIAEKQRQAGIAFPAPRKQDHLLIVRLDLSSTNEQLVSEGLKKLCTLFELIDRGIIEMDDTSIEDGMYSYPLTKFMFTATIGFGKSFFKKLNLLKKCPKNLNELPPHYEIGDKSPYVLRQTDIILQLASDNHVVNKMVLNNDTFLRRNKNLLTRDLQYLNIPENRPLDIMETINGWAKIADVHTGFHRADGRNLMGFYDGISNPYRLFNNNIWISENENGLGVKDGTYMVFQKIEHNLIEWNKLNTQEQENWVGRSKATGLLLGTLSPAEEKRLVSELYSKDKSIRSAAKVKLRRLFDEQRDPTKNFFDSFDIRYLNINKNCPESSHARKTNPRKSAGREQLIFRRGCLYVEDDFIEYPKSGILFISFQNDIKNFEEMKRNMARHIASHVETNERPGREITYGNDIPAENSFDTLTLGGGYYFIPSIPSRRISNIGQQFF
jgi:Dyp-type peroxidase family